MMRPNRTIACALLCGITVVHGQPDEPADTDDVTEEIVVRGASRAALRVQIELAEDAIFDRFNEINSDDEFDIRCRLETRTGTRIPQRVCQANFWRRALAESGESTVRQLQGSSDVGEATYRAEAMYKSRLLEDEMMRLAREDKQLMREITRFYELTTTLENFGDDDRRERATMSRVMTADQQELPYEAAVMAEVRIMSDPWSHVLTHSTFAIAHVFGEVEQVRLDCREQSENLNFELGAEWNVPVNWEPCSVTVEAGRGTTFSLYEFE
jgi:hypothetical protein